jgi:cholesterol transport system auxiliary component
MPQQCLSLVMPAGRRLLILTLTLFLGACSLPLLQSPPEQPTRSYLLEWHAGDVPLVESPRHGSLLISPVLSTPGFDSSDMAYMRKPHEIEYFAHHRWVDAPARMLEPLLVQAAEQSGLFRNVVEAGNGADVDLRLDSRLIHLQQVCRLNPSELQLALRVTLSEVSSARVIATRTLSVSEAILERTPYAGVEAANRAVDRLLSELQGFLVEQLK